MDLIHICCKRKFHCSLKYSLS